MNLKEKKICIIADWLTNQGGAERVIVALHRLYPEAPIYTSVYNPGSVPDLVGADIRTSWLQRLPAKLRNKHQFLLPFFPHAFEQLDLADFDIIISSCSAFSKSVKKTRPHQIHICYCHTPTRYLYHARADYVQNYPLPIWMKPLKIIFPILITYLTKKDQQAARDVDHFISNSNFVGQRIKKYYQRDSTTIYPCIEVDQFQVQTPQSPDSYYLALGRFIPYKNFDLLVRTFIQNGRPLKLGGVGPELEKCKQLAQGAPNIEFLGFVDYEVLPSLYTGAKAFLFPAEEDFGLTPVEAMATGTPIIALGRGGARESVTEKTGVFFDEPTVPSLQEAIDRFEKNEQKFSSKEIIDRASQFDEKVFQEKLGSFVAVKS